jgi:hypothetical protein
MAIPKTSPTTTPAVVRADQPLDATTALLYSPKAPLAEPTVTDHSAVWACVPSGFDVNDPKVLIYFHGHNYFVTAIQNRGKVVARAPDWLSGGRLRAATMKGIAQGPAGPFYKLNALPGPTFPVVLAPEDSSEDTAYGTPGHDYWAREANVGTLATSTTLGDMVDDCLDRLAKLSPSGGTVPTPGTGSYLTKELKSTDMKRLFLTGHSGGGVPLFTAACNAGMALNQPTSLWALDATYGAPAAYGTPPYAVRIFCENWDAMGRLGMGADDSRVVIVHSIPGQTHNTAMAIRDDLIQGGPGGGQTFSVREVKYDGPQHRTALATALKASPIVFVDTLVPHDAIPQTFIPILLEYA